MSRVLVAMSGGVDSSVAAALPARRGSRRHRGHAQALGRPERLGVLQRRRRRGRAARRRAARHPALRLQLHRRVRRARRRVRTSTRTRTRRTPNPCVECNRSIKFGALFERMTALGFDALATGHHARIVRDDAVGRGSRAVATARRTSRTCSTCSGARQLARTLLPVGELTKAEVRAEADAARAAHRDEGREHGRLLHHPRRTRRRSSPSASHARPGAIVDVDGADLGEHDDVGALHDRPAARHGRRGR